MAASNQISILTNCIDAIQSLSVIEEKHRNELIKCTIEELDNYPQTNDESPAKETGSYLYVSMSRCALKLSQSGYMHFSDMIRLVGFYLEAALSLHVD